MTKCISSINSIVINPVVVFESLINEVKTIQNVSPPPLLQTIPSV